MVYAHVRSAAPVRFLVEVEFGALLFTWAAQFATVSACFDLSKNMSRAQVNTLKLAATG